MSEITDHVSSETLNADGMREILANTVWVGIGFSSGGRLRQLILGNNLFLI